jgi:sulfate transport system ATP-binding protein
VNGLTVDHLQTRQGDFTLGPLGFKVGPGEVLAVVGPSGAGKTTLLRALAGFLPVPPGSVSLDGRPLTPLPPQEREVGYVPQGLGLLPHRTVLGNVAYPLEVRSRPDARGRARRFLEDLGLEGLEDRYPNTLSGGERQRVAMARALASEPRWLLWDEPYAGLDLAAREELLELLGETLAEHPLPAVIVAHEPAVAFSLARQFLLLGGGRPRFYGPPDDLRTRPPNAFAARFLGCQNVFSRAELEAHPTSRLAQHLHRLAGPEGLALLSRDLRLGEEEAPGSWPFTLRSLLPGQEGWLLRGASEGLPLRIHRPGPIRPLPSPGSPLWLSFPDEALLPLGPP